MTRSKSSKSKSSKSSKSSVGFTCFEDHHENHPVCPGHEDSHYCDGDSDCYDDSDWCSCAAGISFCNTGVNPCSVGFTCFKDHHENHPVCPGHEDSHYCDGDSDCYDDSDWCSCAAGISFCNTGVNPCGRNGSSLRKIGISVAQK